MVTLKMCGCEGFLLYVRQTWWLWSWSYCCRFPADTVPQLSWGPTSKLVKFKLDIVQMVTMNLPSEDSTLIIVMVLSTRWTKSTLIELDRFTLILMTYVWLEHYRELHHTIIIGWGSGEEIILMKETFKILHIMTLRLSTYKRSMILSRSKELQQTTVKTNGWVPMMTCMNVQTPNRLAIVTIMYNSRFVNLASIKYNDSLCTRWMASFNENDGEYRPYFLLYLYLYLSMH